MILLIKLSALVVVSSRALVSAATTLTVAATLAVIAIANTAHGAAIAVTDPGTAPFDGGSFTLGWQFTANQDITVTDLGIYDDNGDGLAGQADIAIFTNAGVALVNTSLSAGAGTPLIDGFRYGSVAPTALTAGTTYVIASYLDDTYLDFDPSFSPVFSVDPAITLDNVARYLGAGSLVFPTESSLSDRAYVGPNFLFAAVAVPEPGTLALFGLGLAGLAAARRRKAA